MKTYDVEYQVDSIKCRGYMVEPKSQGRKLPGIVMYTDYWGVNVRQKKVAEKLANMGALVFVADMYGNQQCGTSSEDSARLMNSAVEDEGIFKNRILSPYELFLKKNPLVNSDKLFSIGYCFGGVSSLQLARYGEGLCGAISLHGLLSSKIKVPATKKMPKMLILHGARDPLVPEADIKSFQEEMNACNADYTFVSYGLCTHAFSNAEAAGNEVTAYSYVADKRSDYFINQFLNENF
jgi:dienelactone hydrolase